MENLPSQPLSNSEVGLEKVPDVVEPDVLGALRRATAERHDILDRAMPLAAAAPSLADYAAHLALLHAWLVPIEAWLAGYHDGPQDPARLAPAPRAAVIEADLADPAMPPLPQLPTMATPAWPDGAGAAYRWGVCYVIEGSQLGGAVLFKRLRGALAPHPLTYLGADGAAVGARWQQFLVQLRADVTSPCAVADACAGACDAFDRLLALMAGAHE
jgi:heme oxygenase